MKTDERFDDIKKLYETSHQDEAVAYLDAGWRLLKILAKRDEGEFASYVLGWPSVEPPPHPKVKRPVGGNF